MEFIYTWAPKILIFIAAIVLIVFLPYILYYLYQVFSAIKVFLGIIIIKFVPKSKQDTFIIHFFINPGPGRQAG